VLFNSTAIRRSTSVVPPDKNYKTKTIKKRISHNKERTRDMSSRYPCHGTLRYGRGRFSARHTFYHRGARLPKAYSLNHTPNLGHGPHTRATALWETRDSKTISAKPDYYTGFGLEGFFYLLYRSKVFTMTRGETSLYSFQRTVKVSPRRSSAHRVEAWLSDLDAGVLKWQPSQELTAPNACWAIARRNIYELELFPQNESC